MLTAKTDDRRQQRTVTVVEMNHALARAQPSVLKPNCLPRCSLFRMQGTRSEQ